VPQDFGKQEVVWTLTSHGQTERAYGTLKPDYFINDIVIMNNNGAGGAGGGAPDTIGNIGPSLSVDGETFRRVKVGEPVDLTRPAATTGAEVVDAHVTSAAGRAARGTLTQRPVRDSWFLPR
jgi:hypothetical protein